MAERRPHRKRVRHFHDPAPVHELTFSCFRRWPLLTNDLWRRLLATSIDRAMAGHGYRLAAFVFMPEHVHLIVFPLSQAETIDRLLRAIKRPVSYRIKAQLIASRSPLLERLTVQQRPGRRAFRFWQEGPGYDRNLTTAGTTLAAIEYVHLNPVRRGLVTRAVDWEWSSARYFTSDSPRPSCGIPRLDALPAEWLTDTGP